MFIPGQAERGATEYAKDIATGICYYSYDKFNRMIKASPVGAAAAEYIYNGEGLRVGKIADGKTTRSKPNIKNSRWNHNVLPI